MSKRGENIFKRKDGRWEARYVKDYTVSGRIVYGYCYGKSYNEAKTKALLKKIEVLSKNSFEGQCSHALFSFYGEEWLRFQRGNVRDSTYIKYENTLRRHILPFFGERTLKEICTKQIDEFKAQLLGECGLAAKTVRDILSELHMVLRYAAKQLPGAVPEVEIHYPRVKCGEIRVMSIEEQSRLIAYLKKDMDFCKFGTLLALLTGLRIGELCALRWEDISIANRMIHVSASMQRMKNLDGSTEKKTRVVMGQPKSGSSSRLIPMSDSVFMLCSSYPAELATGFVLTGTERYMEPRAMQRRMERYAQDCGMPDIHFHTLRHTFATRCVEASFELKSLSEILGHANTSITMERYVHSSLELKRKNMLKLKDVGL